MGGFDRVADIYRVREKIYFAVQAFREMAGERGKRGISNFIIHSIEVYFVSTAKITCFFAPAIRSPKDVGDKGINTFYLICSILLDISLRRERE